MWYYALSHTDVDDVEDRMILEEVTITCYVILLPFTSKIQGNLKYSLVTSHWQTLDAEANLVQPHTYLGVEDNKMHNSDDD